MRPAHRDMLGLALLLIGALAAIVLTAAAVNPSPEFNLWPRFAAPLVFAFLVKWPHAIPVAAVFAIGLAQDLIIGNVLGAGLLALLLSFLAARPYTPVLANAPFALQWITFAPFVILMFGLEWSLSGLARLVPVPLDPPLIQCSATFLVYPLVALLARPVLLIARRGAARG